MLVGWDETYLQNEKFRKWRKKLIKKGFTKIIMTTIKENTSHLLSLNLLWTIVGDDSVNICIEICEYFKWLKS